MVISLLDGSAAGLEGKGAKKRITECALALVGFPRLAAKNNKGKDAGNSSSVIA